MTQELTVYRGKRDFDKTREPSGRKRIAQATYPRFVIQKHDARRLHYDLRLEIDGTFKSWAVTRGPSLDPMQKRLAVEVEDHPLDYGDFEGTIPKGQYGGGTVMIWDRGFWTPDNGDALDAWRKGELKFTLGGTKLQGSFVLVRIAKDRGKSGRTNWLLIKHRDDWAKPGDGEGVLNADRSVASGRSMERIAAGAGKEPAPFIAITKQARRASLTKKAVSNAQHQKHSNDPKAVAGIKITHPERLIWPDLEITKRDLADYIAKVGDWMLPHVEGRPCSVLRAPDGLAGQKFFQRHLMRGMPDDIMPVAIKGEEEPYIRVDTVAGLVSLVQFGTIEFHPWNSAPAEPERPGRLVFDLDPAPDVPFERVVEAAKLFRRKLEMLGLVPFCKTTGGKGLHVVTPLAGGAPVGWKDAKIFAHAICASIAENEPELYLTSLSKSKRGGRIFLDYLRNERTATAVAPLSPRANPDATVSMPIDWPQVRANLDPKRFTLRTAPALLKNKKPWKTYARSARPLDRAIRKMLAEHS